MDHVELAQHISDNGGEMDFNDLVESLDYQQRATLPTALRNARSEGLISKRVQKNEDGTFSVLVSAVS